MTGISHGSLTHSHATGAAPPLQTTGAPPHDPAWNTALQNASTGAQSPHGPSGSSPAFRPDLAQHLSGPDGFKGNKLNGTHNQDNAIDQVKGRNGTYSLTPTGTPGINEMNYEATNPASGKKTKGSKTTYDPAVHSNQQMLDMAQKAGAQAWSKHQADPNQKTFDVNQNGVNFRAYINNDKAGNPIIGNVHPIK